MKDKKQISRNHALNAGFQFASSAAHNETTNLKKFEGFFSSINLEWGAIETLIRQEIDIGPISIGFLDNFFSNVSPENEFIKNWFMIGFYTIFLLSRSDDVVLDSPLPGTTKNAFFVFLDDYRKILSKAVISPANSNQIIKNITDRYAANLTEKENVITSVIDQLRYEAMAQDKQAEPILILKDSDFKNASNNPWLSGSFYLLTILVICVFLLVASLLINPLFLPVIVIGGIIGVSVVGALQLRNDEKLNDKSFLSLMALSFKYIPLLRKRDNN